MKVALKIQNKSEDFLPVLGCGGMKSRYLLRWSVWKSGNKFLL